MSPGVPSVFRVMSPSSVLFSVGAKIIDFLSQSYTVHCHSAPHPPPCLSQGPFATFHVRQDFQQSEWSSLKFSYDGKKILVSTTIGQLKLVDAFQGHELHTLSVGGQCFPLNVHAW